MEVPPAVAPRRARRAGAAAPALAAAPILHAGTLPQLQLVEVATGLDRPLIVTHSGDGSGRLFIGEQEGRIRVVQGGQLLATPFLDLTALASCCGEQGLLGLAFHPDYAGNGMLYVDYTDTSGTTVVARYQVSAGDPNLADPASALVLLTQSQPFANHNGGHLAFGPDGYLYVALGDGGSAGDPLDSGQDLGTLLGKILRLDVDRDDFPADPGRNYGIPPSNPFVGDPAARPEIWARGLRNPWRFSFDRLTGDLWVADVGQNQWEEVDLQPASSPGGENYGWRLMEGTHCYDPPTGCNDGSLTLPVLEYSHSQGCSITGGFVYRGPSYPNLRGTYLFADYCTGAVSGAVADGGGGWTASTLLQTGFLVTTFGQDEAGELYLSDYQAATGRVLRLVDPSPVDPLFADGFELGSTAGWSTTLP